MLLISLVKYSKMYIYCSCTLIPAAESYVGSLLQANIALQKVCQFRVYVCTVSSTVEGPYVILPNSKLLPQLSSDALMSLCELRKPNSQFTHVKDRVHVLQEHVAHDPEVYYSKPESEYCKLSMYTKVLPTSSEPAMPATQSLDPTSTGPRLNVSPDTVNGCPPKVRVGAYFSMISHGTEYLSISLQGIEILFFDLILT